MNTKERIKRLCKERKISVNKLETDLGFGTGYVSKLDKSTPNTKKIQAIADYFNVSVDYLMTGKEIEFSIEMAEIDVALTNMEKRLKTYALKFAALSQKDQEMIMQMIDRCENK
jgi:transcriptional regulator with XRE-family HTH domain